MKQSISRRFFFFTFLDKGHSPLYPPVENHTIYAYMLWTCLYEGDDQTQ